MKCPLCNEKADHIDTLHNDEVYQCRKCNKVFFDKYLDRGDDEED